MVVNVAGKKEDIDMSTQKKELKVESQRELLGGLSVKNEEREIELENVENAENVRPIFHIILCF